MKLSLQMTMVGGLLFALVCLGVAASGFLSLGEITDATQLADAKGYAWFWTVLGGIGLAVAAVGRWLIRSDARAADGAGNT